MHESLFKDAAAEIVAITRKPLNIKVLPYFVYPHNARYAYVPHGLVAVYVVSRPPAHFL
jgi:hypothetical protein